MLALPPLRSTKDAREGEMEAFSIGDDDFPDFSGINFLDSIDFHDLFVGLHDGDVQSCMEIQPEILPDFSVSGSGDESPEINMAITSDKQVILSEYSREDDDQNYKNNKNNSHKLEKDEVLSAMETNLSKGEEIEIDSKRLEEMKSIATTSSLKEGDKRRKWSSQQAKNSRGKRKTKVDWTPELHKRFVEAVENLGVDKAVPSRILELMGIHCLTRHNIASHLQKYRSHRKHSMAREAEAVACSSRRQQIYNIAAGGGKPNMQAWHATPTMGFPPPMAPPIHHLPFRPLHVWGHPTIGRLMMAKWPQRLVPPSSNPPPPAWAAVPPHPPPAVPSIFHSHHQRVLNALTPATPCFAQPLPATRFAMPPVAGVPPHAVYKPDHGVGGGGPVAPPSPLPPLDLHPTKESIDAAIGDVLAKPWLPLPIGLKPPAGDSVLVELRRQGIPKVPPATSTSA